VVCRYYRFSLKITSEKKFYGYGGGFALTRMKPCQIFSEKVHQGWRKFLKKNLETLSMIFKKKSGRVGGDFEKYTDTHSNQSRENETLGSDGTV
jgi:hypothetical protein